MLKLGIEKKGENVVASVLHLPTNTLAKHSSQSEEKALAYCITDINNKIKAFNWLVTEDNGKNIEVVIFNEFMSVKSKGLTQSHFENWLDKVLKIMPSIHRFHHNDSLYTSYGLDKSTNIGKMIESLFLIEGVDFDIC